MTTVGSNVVRSHPLGSVVVTPGMLESTVGHRGALRMVSWKRALNAGSSKQGKALRAP